MCRGPAWPELATAAAPDDRFRRRAARSIFSSLSGDGRPAPHSRTGGEKLPGVVRLHRLEARGRRPGPFTRVVRVELEVAGHLGRGGLDEVAVQELGRDQLAAVLAHAGEDLSLIHISEPTRLRR